MTTTTLSERLADYAPPYNKTYPATAGDIEDFADQAKAMEQSLSEVSANLDKIIAQRDDLLAACRAAHKLLENTYDHEHLTPRFDAMIHEFLPQLTAAIARAEGAASKAADTPPPLFKEGEGIDITDGVESSEYVRRLRGG
jgi:hypothetical protein